MCGIVGLIHADPNRPTEPEVIRRLCDAIRHRGPDDDGFHLSGPVGLGMRRLSIIDVAGGHQPIYNEDRSKVIVFNGEIYNYRAIRDDLVRRGHRFTTQGDTETILHLYEDLGERCVERLRGMFAFAIWDERRRRLLLARDRFGIKPLYVTHGPWGIAFASELKALSAAGLAGTELDWEALDAYLQLGYIPAPASPFLAVRKLEPGHVLVWSPGEGARTRRYWDLPVGPVRDAEDPVQLVRQSLDESVEAHLVSDVPVAAFLSGGLDSSAVVASMAHLGYDTHAFTVRYHGAGADAADETALARALAQRCGVRLSIVDVHPRLSDCLESIAYALDEPHADDSAIPTWWLSQVVGGSYKVALTGIGGDELFGGYRRHRALGLAAHYARLPGWLRRALAAAAMALPEPRNGSLAVDRLKRFLAADGDGPPDHWLAHISRASDEERAALYQPWLRESVSGGAAAGRFRAHYRPCASAAGAALYFDYKTFLADDVLALSDRLAMAHSLEIRVPLVDHVLVEQVFPLPDRWKIGWNGLKPLLRAATRHRLPAEHFRAPKRGFVGPTGAWLRHELREVLLDELSAARMSRLGYFDSAVVGRMVDEHLARRRNREGILWALLCFSAWHRVTVEEAASRGGRSTLSGASAPQMRPLAQGR